MTTGLFEEFDVTGKMLGVAPLDQPSGIARRRMLRASRRQPTIRAEEDSGRTDVNGLRPHVLLPAALAVVVRRWSGTNRPADIT